MLKMLMMVKSKPIIMLMPLTSKIKSKSRLIIIQRIINSISSRLKTTCSRMLILSSFGTTKVIRVTIKLLLRRLKTLIKSK